MSGANELLAVASVWNMVVGIVIIGAMIVLMMVMPRLKRRQQQADPMPELSRPDRQSGDRVQLSIEKLMVELFDMSREINAQLETRLATLDRLIHEADEKIAELRALSEAMEKGQTGAAGSRAQGEAFRPGLNLGQPPLKTGTAADPQHREIYELADEGLTPGEISRRTGRLVGEVQLILDLRRAEGNKSK